MWRPLLLKKKNKQTLIIHWQILFDPQGETWCKYKLYLDKEHSRTKTVSGTMNPSYSHERKFTFNPVTKQVCCAVLCFFISFSRY